MNQQKFSIRIKLDAVEISAVSMSLRDTLKQLKRNSEADSTYIKIVQTLQKKFQHLAIKMEKEVLTEIKKNA